MRTPALSGKRPQEGQSQGHQQQASAANQTPLSIQQPSATNSQSGQRCPGTKKTGLDCNTISAIANVRQADAAERFNNLAVGEIGVGIITAFVAYFAAKFARDAVAAARENLAHDKRRAGAELRPWITYDSFDLAAHENVTIDDVLHKRGLGGRVNLKNCGKSPAVHLELFTAHKVTALDAPAPHFERPENAENPSGAGPGQRVFAPQRAVGTEDHDAIMGRTASLWLHCNARYKQPGHEGDPYETTVTMRVMYAGKQIMPDGRLTAEFTAIFEGPQNTLK